MEYSTTHDVENAQEQLDNIIRVGSRKKVQCYYSNTPDSYILDAVTGAQYPWKVGSVDEERFFRVINTTGNLDQQSQKAFYENPHTYMKHTKIQLHEDTITNWYENIKKLYPGKYP
jgi:hypothetical protein